MKAKMSWFDWFVTVSFWLMGIAMAVGVIVIALREYWERGDLPRFFFIG
jgi:hypothetical protein